MLRYWDGKYWSHYAYSSSTAEEAGQRLKEGNWGGANEGHIRWTDRWWFEAGTDEQTNDIGICLVEMP